MLLPAQSAVAFFGLPRRTESTASAATVRIDDHSAVRRIDRTASQQGRHHGQGIENLHLKDSKQEMRAVYCPSLQQGHSGSYCLYLRGTTRSDSIRKKKKGCVITRNPLTLLVGPPRVELGTNGL